jgi:hypothetical protein
MDRERLKGHLDLLLLSVPSAGPAHGYAIISALRERSGGTFDLPKGTIYPALHGLEQAGPGQFLGAVRGAQAPGLRRDRQGRGRAGRAACSPDSTARRAPPGSSS